jgi:hypothetical protein
MALHVHKTLTGKGELGELSFDNKYASDVVEPTATFLAPRVPQYLFLFTSKPLTGANC